MGRSSSSAGRGAVVRAPVAAPGADLKRPQANVKPLATRRLSLPAGAIDLPAAERVPAAPARTPTPARPFVKWAGGKSALLHELLARVPERHGWYYEPFLGGGALFFALQPARAHLSDINDDLIQLYQLVQTDHRALVRALAGYTFEESVYYAIRALEPHGLSPARRAARMLYLNRTCFNGLYRVNRRGQFNVPIGRYSNPRICDPEGLAAAAAALHDRTICRCSFDVAAARMCPGDFAYFDPPYHPVSETARFTSYTCNGFGEADQRSLARVFDELTARGVACMLTNSDTPLVHALYRAHRIEYVHAPRSISRNGQGRGKVREVIVRNY